MAHEEASMVHRTALYTGSSMGNATYDRRSPIPDGGYIPGRNGDARRDEGAVQKLLDRLARAVTSGDGKAAADLWETPALVLGDQEVHAASSREELESFFGGAKAQYNGRGIIDTRAEIVRLQWITDRMALVQVRWPYLDASGREVGEETSTYTLRRDDADNLKLRSAVMHGAATRENAPS